ncbi:hypothetical protein [Streptomyces aurantiogriseus]|uniref:Uncharacterized protein n=1 Tax=Streptomyces aurantiogriseus TaxID=66870 RepID=A0A918FMT3_9ACTN|nr:hypothetical protein [Streptomyces aurantiogriseus]GGR56854.1 hypothetical protein GCM10010251_87200 [Streptomyces aurantiogriseus]
MLAPHGRDVVAVVALRRPVEPFVQAGWHQGVDGRDLLVGVVAAAVGLTDTDDAVGGLCLTMLPGVDG